MPYVIYVRGGVYYGHTMIWSHSSSDQGPNTCYNLNSISPDHSLTITAYENEKPVFEGQGHSVLIDFRLQNGECSNVTIEGLTIRHYVNFAIRFRGDRDTPSGWNGCNTIRDNTFEEIGNLYNTSNCPGCIGYGAIDLVNSDNNVIRDNVFANIENTAEHAVYLHTVYFAHGSSDNEVHHNYVSMTSGDPMKVRDASNNNYIHDNYVDRSGKRAFIMGTSVGDDEALSSGNIIEDNTVTFPYPLFDEIQLICTGDPCDDSSYIDRGQKLFEGDRPDTEEVGAVTAGDFDGDGQSELVVAFNYDDLVKVVRTTGGDDRHLQEVLYTSRSFTVHEFATGDFDGSGSDQILTFFQLKSTGGTYVYRGDGLNSIVNLGRLYDSSVWDVTAMTAGDFDGDGESESIVALRRNSDGESRIYRGNGTSSILNLGQLYSSPYWHIPAMTAGDFNGDGQDELLSALHCAAETRIYRGDGTSSALNYARIYTSSAWDVPAMAAGYFDGGSVPQLVTAFKQRNGEETRLYNGNGVNSATNSRFYTNSNWRVSALAAGQFDGYAPHELATAFTWSTRTQIWAGDGTSSATNRGVFYRWSAP